MAAPRKRKVKFLINPRSGNDLGRVVFGELQEVLGSSPGLMSDMDCDIELTREGRVLDQVMAAGDVDTIVAVGGDGTAMQVVEGIVQAGRGSSLALIPLGTANDLSRALGLYGKVGASRERLLRAIDLVRGGKRAMLDVLSLNGEFLFTNYFSLGLDAKIIREFNAIRRKRFVQALRRSTLLSYAIYFLIGWWNIACFVRKGLAIEIFTDDGQWKSVDLPWRLRTVIVSNLPLYAGGSVIGPDARLDDGKFELTLIRNVFQYLLLMFTRVLYAKCFSRMFRQYRVRAARIFCPNQGEFQLNGEDYSEQLRDVQRIEVKVHTSIPVVVL